MQVSDNKRIVFNSVVLYIKLILSTIIGLYTSRAILMALGASDYGLYNLVGGVVTMMNFMGTTMISVTNRFIIVEIGKGEGGNCRKVFNTSLIIHIFLAFLIVILGNTAGIYYIENIANIPHEKIDDAIYVLHLSVLACVFNTLYIPYNGLILAREKFVFTSFVEIGRNLLKLIFVLYLSVYLGNKLRLFANIMALYSLMLPLSMFIYCQIKDSEVVKWQFNRCWNDYKKIFSFAFWIMIGAVAYIGQAQGANIIINFFYGTILNAAYGIANQVNNYVMLFVRSFNQAALPQIMKTQGNDKERSVKLVYLTTKYSFLILLLPMIPLILNMDFVLELWLKNVPAYTNIFVITLLVTSLIRSLGSGFDATIQASGKVRLNQIVYSTLFLGVLPLAFFLYKLGCHENTINILILITSIVVLIFQTIYLSKISDLTIKGYFTKTIKPCLLVFGISVLPLLIIKYNLPPTRLFFVIQVIISLIWTITTVFLIGMGKTEKQAILKRIHKNVQSK